MEQQSKNFLTNIAEEEDIMKSFMIKDLAKEMEISTEELRMIRGGISPQPEPPRRWYLMIDRWRTFLKPQIETIPLPE